MPEADLSRLREVLNLGWAGFGIRDKRATDLLNRYRESHPTLVARLEQEVAIDRSFRDFHRRVAPNLTEEQLKEDLAKRAKKAFARPVALRMPSGALPDLLRDGRAKSQFETGSSSALYSPEIRAAREEQMFGLPKDLDPAKRPIYGYLMTAGPGKSGPKSDGLVGGYGDVQVVLRGDVRSRTTAMVGDSADMLHSGRPAPIDNPDWRAFTPAGSAEWQPELERLDRRYGSEAFNRNAYVEAQIHGGITLKDVDYIALSSEPDVLLRQLLEQSGVNWRVTN